MLWIKSLKILGIILGIFACYEAAGILIAYVPQPKISEEYQENFKIEDYYSDEIGTERAVVIEDNQEALVQRLRMIEHAQAEIILSTFEFRSDESGKEVMAALLQAAERGVQVKIVIDGISAFKNMYGNDYFKALSTLNTVEIKVYNEINLFTPWKLMGRLHDKYLIVDDDLYLLGGRNTYNYFLGDQGYQNYDREVLVYSTDPDDETTSINELKSYFESIWQSTDCNYYYEKNGAQTKGILAARQELTDRSAEFVDRYGEQLDNIDYMTITMETNKISLLYNPIHVYAKEPTVFYALCELMKTAKTKVDLHTPYIICNRMMYERLTEVCDQSNTVQMMTNSVANNGNPFGAMDYSINKAKILATGLQIYEYEGGVSYHGKSLTIDQELAIVGSFNLDMRSVYLDTELMVVVDSPKVTAQLNEYMAQYEAEAIHAITETTYEIPEGMQQQTISEKRQRRIWFVKLLYPFRFLM